MSDYTPSTNAVRIAYMVHSFVGGHGDTGLRMASLRAEFDRWLTGVKAAAAAEALRDAADDIERNSLTSIKRNGMNVRFAVMLRAHADDIHRTPSANDKDASEGARIPLPADPTSLRQILLSALERVETEALVTRKHAESLADELVAALRDLAGDQCPNGCGESMPCMTCGAGL